MAINFPNSPTNGQQISTSDRIYTYDASSGRWDGKTTSIGADGLDSSSIIGLVDSAYVASRTTSVDFLAVSSNILPDADSSRDLGSPTKKWKDLHLSGNTLFLGDSGSISASTGGEIILPSLKIGTGDNAVKLEADATGKLKTKSVVSGVTQAAEEPGSATVLSDMAGLIALTGMSVGQTALVTSLNKVFMYTGTGWFLIATMTNSSPTAITGVDATYALAVDGTATTITAVSTDPEGFPLTWSYAVTTGSLGSTATVSQADNVFTITPSTNVAHAGTFSITFSVTDGATGAVSAVSAFSLNFAPPASSVLFTTVGTHNWTVPAGLTSVSVVCIGAGGAHNTGHVGSDKSEFGGFVLAPSGWKNTSLTPAPSGTHLTAGFQGGAGGGAVGGGNGSGGGAAGYYGNGGNGQTGNYCGKGGGGVGVYGGPLGPSPTGGQNSTQAGVGGIGRFGGSNGQGQSTNSSLSSYWLGHGGSFGGGGGHCSTTKLGGSGGSLGYGNNIPVTPGSVISVKVGGGVANGGPSGIPGMGAVRVMWGSGRSYPNTNVSNSYNVDAETTV